MLARALLVDNPLAVFEEIDPFPMSPNLRMARKALRLARQRRHKRFWFFLEGVSGPSTGVRCGLGAGTLAIHTFEPLAHRGRHLVWPLHRCHVRALFDHDKLALRNQSSHLTMPR